MKNNPKGEMERKICLGNGKGTKLHKDKILMLFARDPIFDQGKYKSVAQINRTPVMISGHISKFKNENKWNDWR